MDYPYELGFRAEVIAFFTGAYTLQNNTGLLFSYSSCEYEHYSIGHHRIPTACGLWLSRTENLNLVRLVILCGCAMDALRYLNINFVRFGNLDELLFISVGSSYRFAPELRSRVGRAKVSMLFSKDILGLMTKIKLAFFLLDKTVQIHIDREVLTCTHQGRTLHFEQENLSLAHLLRAFKIRTYFRSCSVSTMRIGS